jgi:hypothetical protein
MEYSDTFILDILGILGIYVDSPSNPFLELYQYSLHNIIR